MAWGPNLAPGRCEVPPSNGAPMMRMSVPAHEAGSARSAGGTPRNVASGPYMLPSRAMTTSPSVRAGCCPAGDPAEPAHGERHHHAEQYDAHPRRGQHPASAVAALQPGSAAAVTLRGTEQGASPVVAGDVTALDGDDVERGVGVPPDGVITGRQVGVDRRVLHSAGGPAFPDLRVRAPGGRAGVRADLDLAAVQVRRYVQHQRADTGPDVEYHAAGVGRAWDMLAHHVVLLLSSGLGSAGRTWREPAGGQQARGPPAGIAGQDGLS